MNSKEYNLKVKSWVENVQNKNYRCKTYCGYLYEIGDEGCCMFPPDECFLELYKEIGDAAEFDTLVNKTVISYIEAKDMACIKNKQVLCEPYKYSACKDTKNCGLDCLIQQARIEVEQKNSC